MSLLLKHFLSCLHVFYLLLPCLLNCLSFINHQLLSLMYQLFSLSFSFNLSLLLLNPLVD